MVQYLLSLIFYYLLIPLIATENRKYAGVILAGTIILAIAVGFDNSVGYYMSLSRIFVFLPFFVYGYYIGHGVFCINDTIQGIRQSMTMKIASLTLALIVCVTMYKQNLSAGALFGSVPYQQGELLWYIRLEMIVVAFIWSGIFMVNVPNRKIFGQLDTFPVYVMHGFVVLLLKKHNPFSYSLPVNLLVVALISIALILLFGNKYVNRMAKFFFRGEWVFRIWDRVSRNKSV